MAALYLARFRCVGFLTRTRSAFSPSLLRNRTCYFSAFIPIGLSIKNRYMVQCQTSPVGIPDVGSKLIYYHDSLAKLRRKRRNFIVAIYLAMRRFVRMCLRVCQLLIMYTPLLIAYPFMRGSENRLQRWRLWALYLVERSGPAFIKFAQWASTRRDLFSKEFCDLFSQLHTSTKPHSWKRTQKAMEEALGPDWRRFFQDFEEKPCGSGCVAQVHKARLDYIAIHRSPAEVQKRFESSDRPWVDVAIKVTHPSIRETIADDMAILSFVASIMQIFVPKSRYIDPQKCLAEFRTALIRQISIPLDMRYEGDALRVFSQQFEGDKSVHFPRPLFQTEDILIETFEEGDHISNYVSHADTELKRDLAKMGMSALLKMVFVNNFVHGDLHPGNILVQEYVYARSKSGFLNWLRRFFRNLLSRASPGGVTLSDDMVGENRMRLVFLDAGISIRLSEHDLRNFRAVFRAVIEGNGEKVAELMLRFAPQQRCPDVESFKKDLAALVKTARSSIVSLGSMDVSSLLTDLLSTVSRHRVSLEPNFSGVILAVLVLEGLGRSLYPQMDLIEEARPVLFSVI